MPDVQGHFRTQDMGEKREYYGVVLLASFLFLFASAFKRRNPLFALEESFQAGLYSHRRPSLPPVPNRGRNIGAPGAPAAERGPNATRVAGPARGLAAPAAVGAVPLPSKMVGMHLARLGQDLHLALRLTPASVSAGRRKHAVPHVHQPGPDARGAPGLCHLAGRGTNAPGSVPSDVPIIFPWAAGYSKETFVPSRKSYAKDTWAWLVSKERAEAMAAQAAVAACTPRRHRSGH